MMGFVEGDGRREGVVPTDTETVGLGVNLICHKRRELQYTASRMMTHIHRTGRGES